MSEYLFSVLGPMILDGQSAENRLSGYLIKTYSPQLGIAVADAKISFYDKFIIWKKFMGILMKCLVAFTYKEGSEIRDLMYTIGDPETPIFYTWWGLEIASFIIPTWNNLA